MIYKENDQRKKKAFWLILPVITLSLCLCALIEYFNFGFRWAFELGVLVCAVAVTYRILRTGYRSYEYKVIDRNFVILQKIGSGERYLFTIGFPAVRRVIFPEQVRETEIQLGQNNTPAYYVKESEGEVYGLVYREEATNCDKMITFKPTAQLVEILLKTAVDNSANP